jgi:type VI secretion system secreted protein Hcp
MQKKITVAATGGYTVAAGQAVWKSRFNGVQAHAAMHNPAVAGTIETGRETIAKLRPVFTSSPELKCQHPEISSGNIRRFTMRIVHQGRLFVLCGVISALLAAVPAMAAVDAYMTVRGVKQGPIKGAAASGEIQLIGVVRDTATGMSSGKATHSTITITKKLDAASPKLATAASSGEVLKTVEIVFSGGSGDAKTAQKIVLTNATIASLRYSGGDELITFDYQAIEVTYAKGGKTASDDWSTPK